MKRLTWVYRENGGEDGICHMGEHLRFIKLPEMENQTS